MQTNYAIHYTTQYVECEEMKLWKLLEIFIKNGSNHLSL